MQILKADGNLEEFKERKLITSLKRAGAKPHEIDNIVLVPIVRTAFKSLQEDVIIDIAFHHALKALQLLDDSQNESDRGLSEAVFKLVKIYSTAWGG